MSGSPKTNPTRSPPPATKCAERSNAKPGAGIIDLNHEDAAGGVTDDDGAGMFAVKRERDPIAQALRSRTASASSSDTRHPYPATPKTPTPGVEGDIEARTRE